MAIIYVRGPNPIWFFNNLTGAPLNDTYYAFFLTNDLPYVPQAVYQDPNGISAWPDPIEFQPSAGLPNNLYFNPTQTYRIEVRQGPDQTYPLIWLVQNYTVGNGNGGGSGIQDPLTVAANIITDANFSDVSFNGSYTYTQGSSGTYTLNVAPGWQLILVGAGTTILTQGTLQGSSNTFGNPPYYLGINNSGWTSASLVQTLSNNGAIFAEGAIAVSFTAQSITTAQPITINYVPNGPANSQTIFPTTTITTAGFMQYYGAALIGPSLNTNLGAAASTQIQFVLPPSGNVELTNIQVTGQSNPLSTDFVLPSGTDQGSVPDYQELSYPQIVNAEFNVYRDSILNHPKDTILTGWNFALNPWQFSTTTVTAMAQGTSAYSADQTLILQQEYIHTSGGTDSNISVGQSAGTFNYGLEVKYAKANNQFALLQYIDPNSIRPYWGQNLSAMVKALISTSNSTMITFKMRLIYIAGLPSSTSDVYPIASWTAGGDPVFAAGVTGIVPQNDPVYTLSSATPMFFPFDKFIMPASTNVNMTLGVLLYTTSNMASGDFIVFNDISLVQNDFAVLSNPQTYGQVLRDCQYYYEMSYESFASVAQGSIVASQLSFPQNATAVGGSTNMYPNIFTLSYKASKRANPTTIIYSPVSGAAANVATQVWSNGYATTYSGDLALAGNWNVNIGINYLTFYPTSGATNGAGGAGTTAPLVAALYLHYTADCRLG